MGGDSDLHLQGSSPLARGTPVHREGITGARRLIPARAGNTSVVQISALTPAAHPRSRGEHAEWLGKVLGPAGSSPLARGTHSRQRRYGRARRLIPARAGNTQFAPASVTAFTAHPRSRGEHIIAAAAVSRYGGSSPLARGTRWCPALG